MKEIIKTNQIYTYERLKNDLLFLNYEYPIFKINNIGKSILGENMYYLKLGEGNKKLGINASHHANEWITSLIIMMFVEKYLFLYGNKQNYKGYNIEDIWKRTSLYVIPMVNPDGVNLCLNDKKIIELEKYQEIWKPYERCLQDWKANIRGVDLNLNYPTGWQQAVKNKKKIGVTRAGPRDYPGPNAVSEVETKNMMQITDLLKFDMTISLHSQGKEIYEGYYGKEDKKAYEIGKLFEKVSGYTLTKPNYNSSFAGYKDWFVETYQKPGYTIEIGQGEEGKSLPLSDVKEIYKQVEEIFFIALENC